MNNKLWEIHIPGRNSIDIKTAQNFRLKMAPKTALKIPVSHSSGAKKGLFTTAFVVPIQPTSNM